MLWPFVLPNREITALHISLALSLALPLSLPLSAFLPLSLYLCLILSTALSQPHFSTLPRSTSVILLVLSSSLFPPLKLSSSAFLQRNCQPLCKWNIHPALIGLSTCFLFVWPGTGQQSLPPAYQKTIFEAKKRGAKKGKEKARRYLWKWLYHLPHVSLRHMSWTHSKLEVILSISAHAYVPVPVLSGIEAW